MITYLLEICHVYSPGYPHSILLQFLMILYPKYTSNVATSFLFPGHHISSGLYQVWLNHHDYLLTDVLAFMLTPNSYPVHFPLVAQSLLFLSMSNVAPTLTYSSEPCTSLSPINWLTSFLPQDLRTCHPLYKSCSFSSFRPQHKVISSEMLPLTSFYNVLSILVLQCFVFLYISHNNL